MDDLISRQAVKELAHNQMREKYCGMALKKQRDFYIKLADSIIDLLPAVHPEPHWIPVKEKNPIEYDNPIEFLVTLEDPSGERYIELLMWDGYEWDEIYTDDNELGIWGQDEVIAWCKPLEPYKGVTE